jgi:hypothetical protein
VQCHAVLLTPSFSNNVHLCACLILIINASLSIVPTSLSRPLLLLIYSFLSLPLPLPILLSAPCSPKRIAYHIPPIPDDLLKPLQHVLPSQQRPHRHPNDETVPMDVDTVMAARRAVTAEDKKKHHNCYRPLDPGTSPPRSTEMLAARTAPWS